MPVTTWTKEESVFPVVLTDVNGNAIFDVDLSTFTNPVASDQGIRIDVEAKAGTASAGHMAGVYEGAAAAVYRYTGSPASLAALTATTNSTNPLNSTTAGFAAARPSGVDASTFGTSCSVALTVASPKIRITVNIKGPLGANIQNASVTVWYRLTRWGIT